MKKTKTIIICIVLITLAVAIFTLLVETAPEASSRKPERQALLIECTPISTQNESIILELTGKVTPDQEIIIRSRVQGEITYTSENFIKGGLVKKGDLIIQIDPVDYQLALTNAQAKLEQAKFNYDIELGRQAIAQREWELLNPKDATPQEQNLALRGPHLRACLASLQAAKANLKAARLNLERTKIYAPFDALITSDEANLGLQINTQTPLGTLVGIDRFFVEAPTPLDRIRWINIPGSKAIIKSNTKEEYKGEVIKLSGSLIPQGRMANLIISVDNPWEPSTYKKKPLLLNEYVKIYIEGINLTDVLRIPRRAFRENNTVWINDDNSLKIMPVNVIFKENESILVKGIPSGSQIIISDIAAPVPGRLLRTE